MDLKEPRLKSSKLFDYKCLDILGIHKFFTEESASSWCLESFVNKFIDEETELNFEQIQELFLANLDHISNQRSVCAPIRAFCLSYIEWMQECAILGNHLRQKRKHKEIAESFVSENAKYVAFQSAFQRPQRETRAQTPPIQSPRSQTPITPNKRMIEHEKVKQYIESIQIVCAFGIDISELEKLVGNDLVDEISSYKSRIPSVWTKGLEKYFENALDKAGKNFKLAIQEEIEGGEENENKFRLYCEKVLMEFYNLVDVFPTLPRTIKERKFIIYHISPLFMFYESTFRTLEFDWIEARVRSAKIMKTSNDSGITLVDVKGVRVSDDKEIWHMEVSGPPTYRLTLYALSMLEDGQFVAYELASAELPFDFDSRSKYMAVMRMMAIFHDEVVQQKAIMDKIDRILIPCNNRSV
ncbi:22764_t:CDS:2, partial [Gigaspora margarita]